MIPDNNALVLFRFSKHKWANTIINGKLSFSCAGKFVDEAIKDKNDVQGDKYEGIFARIYKNDVRLQLMRDQLGDDLEEIEDEEYVLLRRKSAMLKPIFCIYGYKAGDALSDSGDNHLGETHIVHQFDPKMYQGFSGDWKDTSIPDEDRFTMLILNPEPFLKRVNNALKKEKLSYRIGIVDYNLRGEETFFIQPTDNYDELFYKRPEYWYQYEDRIVIKNINFKTIDERYPLSIGTLDKSEYKKEHMPLEMHINAVIGDRSTLSGEEREVLRNG